jgi:hypothetical protein
MLYTGYEKARATLRHLSLNTVLLLLLPLLALRIGLHLSTPELPAGYDARAYLGATHAIRAGESPFDHHAISAAHPAGGWQPWPGVGTFVPYTPFYLYPPFLALGMLPLTFISYTKAMAAWLLAVVAASLLLIPLLRFWVGWRLAAVGVLGCVHIWESAWLGQINAFIALSLALALYSYAHNQKALSGIWLALGMLLKVTPVLGLLVLAARRTWQAIGAAALVVLGVVALSRAFVPFSAWYEGFLAASGERWGIPGVISWTGKLHYWFGDPGLLLGMLLAGGLLLLTLARAPAVSPLFALAAAALLPLLVAHIAWAHHTVMALPALAVLYSQSMRGAWLAVITWLAIAFGGGLLLTLLLTLCWMACCWPRLLERTAPAPILPPLDPVERP